MLSKFGAKIVITLEMTYFKDIIVLFWISILLFQESKYGAHIFHTKHDRVWEYLQSFSNWTKYEHRVKGYVRDIHGNLKLVPIPPNQVVIKYGIVYKSLGQNIPSL